MRICTLGLKPQTASNCALPGVRVRVSPHPVALDLTLRFVVWISREQSVLGVRCEVWDTAQAWTYLADGGQREGGADEGEGGRGIKRCGTRVWVCALHTCLSRRFWGGRALDAWDRCSLSYRLLSSLWLETCLTCLLTSACLTERSHITVLTPFTSFLTHHTSHIPPYTSHITHIRHTPHTSYLTPHTYPSCTSHLTHIRHTPHTSHISAIHLTHHTSHITHIHHAHHTSHISAIHLTPHTYPPYTSRITVITHIRNPLTSHTRTCTSDATPLPTCPGLEARPHL